MKNYPVGLIGFIIAVIGVAFTFIINDTSQAMLLLVMAIIGLVLSILGIKNDHKVLSIIGVIISLLLFLLAMAGMNYNNQEQQAEQNRTENSLGF